jgi:hypothetical protein
MFLACPNNFDSTWNEEKAKEAKPFAGRAEHEKAAKLL